ncbi:Phosphorylase b kinase regulatory subunit [Aphelenchoides besseyi]|nr:Phosphorylase b kinase regulatory subunit [Aphelenchoides besseyi]KAI6235585.1 Phosphorylase b kinase regulatory subunit [Aphelenchoides besseyi]
MRSRTSSGLRLDQLMLLVDVTILKHQDPVTGLVANNEQDFPGHAWVRDNLYAAHALWAMYRAYQKSGEFDEDLARAHELKMECIKIMQSLMECMMRQVDKVERFKKHQRSTDGLHAKYSVHTKGLVVTDGEWGHLQIDATSLFLLTLAQMTASGLQIIRNFDEVAFIQNLVYYVEIGYRTPDFGVWERGDKTNQGIRELNASSIGMAKAALQAINDVGDMFGDGSKGSVIHVLPDEIQQCSAVLSSMLPRESFSKETDASLLAIISYPAFAVEDQDLVDLTRHTITETLLGKYGCRRFLRDGYKTALEDPSRLYYINAELQKFENIECEWPVFLCYLLLDSLFRRDDKDSKALYNRLQDILVSDSDDTNNKSIRLLPELYKVPYENVELERQNHGTQTRVPAGTTPFIWAQSLYVIGCLVHDGFLLPAEIDPLSRRFSGIEKRPSSEVQVVVLAETCEVQRELAKNDILVQTTDEIDPVFSIQPASAFAKILERVGESKKLGLTGRPMDRDIGLLSTSRLYHLGQKFVVFTPQFMDRRRSHLIYDIRILMDEWSSELQYIYNSWNSVSISGRPLVVLTIASNMLDTSETFHYGVKGRRQKSSVIGALKKIKNGYIGGARVVMKNISEFFRTTSVSKLELRNADILDVFSDETSTVPRSLPLTSTELRDPGKHVLKRYDSIKERYSRQFSAVHQASMRHRSIVMDSNDSDLAQLRLAYAQKMKQTEPARDLSPVIEIKSPEKSTSPHHSHLHTAIPGSASPTLLEKIDHNQMKEMNIEDLISMLVETTILDEQASLVHFLYLKLGMDYDTKLNGVSGVTVKVLIEEVYLKACECREWSWVRLMAGLLNRQLDELSKAVTHLLVRQKQITVGMPSKNERAITSPKNKEDLRLIWKEAYIDDPNSYTLSQEIIICLGSLVRTDPNLFIEMLRLRIGLIIQVLASEISRIRCVSGSEALQQLLSVSPFELKSMLFSLLSGRLLEDVGVDEEAGIKELRTGMGSFRKQIEERKSMRKSKSLRAPQILESIPDTVIGNDASDVEDLEEDFQFGIWLRHRRIDGALNRVPSEFYANLWDTVRLFPQGLSINGIVLHRSLTQEMTRREIKFALQVEQVLNQISEPEYREMIVEVLTLMRRLEQLLLGKPQITSDRPFNVDQVLWRANHIFCEHNREMNTLVMECCASGMLCKSARGLCKHFYDSAPAGEFGTAHYMIKALIDIFTVDI